MKGRRRDLPLSVGFVLILLGYLTPWLPHEAAGLSFIGIEMGEWVKFLPAVQAGELLPTRDLFYLPPVTLALMMILLTGFWPERRWQTWAMRALALLVAMLAFPSAEAILYEPSSEWLLRLVSVGGVALVALGMPLIRRVSEQGIWLVILALALTGAIVPSWAYLAVRPLVAALLLQDVGVGLGVWLNLAGHATVAATAVWALRSSRDHRGREWRAEHPVRSI